MFLKFSRNLKSTPDLKSFSDAELIQNFNNTDNRIFIGELFERYTHLVFGVCMKYLRNEDNSKDAVMQIFEKLFTDLKRQEITHFKSWLYSVSKNHCLMALRKEKSIQKAKTKYIAEQGFDLMESEAELHLKYDQKNKEDIRLRKALEKLNTEQRTCIELLYLQNKSYKEVVEITGFDYKKVKSHIQNGKRKLKIYLEQ